MCTIMFEKRFFQLPDVILIDILSRLPLRSICFCKCVCKSLLYLITSKNQELCRLHLSRSHPQELIFQFHGKFIASNTLHLINDQKLMILHLAIKDLQLTKTKFFVYSNHIIKNSCCGLLYLIDILGIRPSIVTNPINGEYIVLPRDTKHACNLASWLGFCSITNQFKVVRIFYHSIGVLSTQIYELGSNSWREIEAAPFYFDSQAAGHTLNGAIYWGGHDKIYFFCFEKEKFGTIQFPIFGYGKYQNGLWYVINVGMLRDCLSLCDIKRSDQPVFNVWVMKENGIHKYWSKENVVDIGGIAMSLVTRGDFRMVKYLSNGELLMMPKNKSEFVCFDPIHKTIRCLNLESNNGCLKDAKCRVIVYSPSLVSLKDVIKYGNNVKVLNFKSRDNIELSSSGKSESVKIVEYLRFVSSS